MTALDANAAANADADADRIEPGPGPEALALTLAALREVLGEDAELAPATELFTLPGFDSMGLAALVDGLEARLGAPLDDDLLDPDAFATPATIAARLVGPTLRGEPR